MEFVNLTIDNKSVKVEKGTSILEAAHKVGVDIPTLCYMYYLYVCYLLDTIVVRHISSQLMNTHSMHSSHIKVMIWLEVYTPAWDVFVELVT